MANIWHKQFSDANPDYESQIKSRVVIRNEKNACDRCSWYNCRNDDIRKTNKN